MQIEFCLISRSISSYTITEALMAITGPHKTSVTESFITISYKRKDNPEDG